jgi:Sec-independent protein translocase protein TatA
MKTFNTRGILLGVALFGAGTVSGFGSSASAAPRDRDVREARKDVKEAKKEVREERKDLRQADSPREREEARRELRNAQGDLQREKRDLRNERQDNRKPVYGQPGRPNSNRPGYNRPPFQGGPNQGRPAPGRPGNNWNSGRRYTGTVTNVRSNQSFDIKVGNTTYNVYTTSRTPRGLTRGDQVQVTGVQQYSNDIRNASVSILRNR